MKRFKIIYEKRDFREIWIYADSEEQAERLFENNYLKYDEESDEADVDLNNLDVLEVTEIDEDGNEI